VTERCDVALRREPEILHAPSTAMLASVVDPDECAATRGIAPSGVEQTRHIQ